MGYIEYLEKYHEITQRALGSALLAVINSDVDAATRELERCNTDLDELDEFYKVNSTEQSCGL
jgi:phosphate uptake regulator